MPWTISGVKLPFSKKMPVHALELDILPFGLHVYHRFLKDVDPFGHGLCWTPLEFLTKALLHWSLLRGLFLPGSLELRSFPHECLCLYPLSDEFDQARWSQRTFLLSLSDGSAVELREKSLRQASPFRDEGRRHASSASIGACRRPTLGLDNIDVCVFTHVRCADGVGSATSCCTLLDAAVAKRLPCALGLTVQCPPERGGSPAGLSECGGLRVAGVERGHPRSCAELGDSAGLCGARRLRLMRRWKPLTAPLPCGCFAHLCVGAV